MMSTRIGPPPRRGMRALRDVVVCAVVGAVLALASCASEATLRCPGPPSETVLQIASEIDVLTFSTEDLGAVARVVDASTDGPAVEIALCEDAAAMFGAFTRDAVGAPIIITVDGVEVAAPVLTAPILGGRMLISGLTAEEAAALTAALRPGVGE